MVASFLIMGTCPDRKPPMTCWQAGGCFRCEKMSQRSILGKEGGEAVTKQGWDTFLQPLHWSFLSLFLSFSSPQIVTNSHWARYG